nr:glycoside hydrolase domain-containing protein [Granulicella aggregans]
MAKLKSGTSAAAFGMVDAKDAVQAAKREGFPAGAILFLDQEEGGRLLQEQADYLFAWTEGVTTGGFRAGAYVSGQPVPDGPGKTTTTAQNIKDTVSSKHLHSIALFVAQDGTPPSNGCTVTPPPLAASGTQGAIAWQFSQSPRRSVVTQAYMKTYANDGNCYVPELPGVLLDLDVAQERDPSQGR